MKFKKCLFCKNKFKLVRPEQKYCCHKCFIDFTIKNKLRSGNSNPMWGKKKTPEQIEKSASKIRGRANLKNSGENNSKWKGGRNYTGRGYVKIYCKNHPSTKGKRNPYVLEHRLVMEKYLGRYLTSKEIIHHKNGIKDDNRIQNLELISEMPHLGKVKCPSCSFKFSIR